jgi:ABC-type polysaccharide/polyol phosphate export permease
MALVASSLVRRTPGDALSGFNATYFWRQVHAVTVANLKSRYRKTVAGFLWVVLNPVISFGVQGLVFGRFLKIGVDDYLLFLVSGLIPWIFLSQTMEMCTPVFAVSGPLMKSFSVSPLVYLSAQVLDNIINFIAAFALVLTALAIYYGYTGGPVFLVVLPFLAICWGAFGISWLLATLQVFFRDTRFLIRFVVQIGFFLTPVFYPPEFIPEAFRWFVDVNPLFYLISPFQILIHDYHGGLFWQALLKAFFVSFLINVFASWVWRRCRNLVYFYV